MKFSRPLGHSWFGYGLILCVLCICLTWSSSYWIIPMKQNFKHSLKNTVWQFKCCYFYFIVIIITIISIFFKPKKDKLYSLHYWKDWYGWSLLKDDTSSREGLVIQSNQRLTWVCQISQHAAKKITKWIIVTRTLDIAINHKLYRDFNFWRQQHVFVPAKKVVMIIWCKNESFFAKQWFW